MRNVGLGFPEEVEDGFFIKYDTTLGTTVPKIEINFQDLESTVKISSGIGRYSGNNFDRVSLNTEAYMEVSCHSPMSFSAIKEKILDPIRDFLNLAIARPNSLTSVTTNFGSQKVIIHTQNTFKCEKRFSLFNKGIIVFLAKDIIENPEHHFSKWFCLRRDMFDVCELFFSIHYDQGAFNTNKLLNIVQAIEAYCRDRYGKYKIPKREYKEFGNRPWNSY